jgi:hypothetical protein
LARKRRKLNESITGEWLQKVNPAMTLEQLKKQKQIPGLFSAFEFERSPKKNPTGGGAYSNRRKF